MLRTLVFDGVAWNKHSLSSHLVQSSSELRESINSPTSWNWQVGSNQPLSCHHPRQLHMSFLIHQWSCESWLLSSSWWKVFQVFWVTTFTFLWQLPILGLPACEYLWSPLCRPIPHWSLSCIHNLTLPPPDVHFYHWSGCFLLSLSVSPRTLRCWKFQW